MKPDGFILFFSSKGHIYEGQATENGANGWGRLISQKECQCGYWKNDQKHGNFRSYFEDEISEEGWYENGQKVAGFKYGLVNFKDWQFHTYFVTV